MRLTVEIETGDYAPCEIENGAGELAADLLRQVARTAEVGGVCSGPLWDHGQAEPKRIGRYTVEISREGLKR